MGIFKGKLLLGFLMYRVLLAPVAILLDFDLSLDLLLVLARPIVHALAGRTLKLNEVVLAHSGPNLR